MSAQFKECGRTGSNREPDNRMSFRPMTIVKGLLLLRISLTHLEGKKEGSM